MRLDRKTLIASGDLSQEEIDELLKNRQSGGGRVRSGGESEDIFSDSFKPIEPSDEGGFTAPSESSTSSQRTLKAMGAGANGGSEDDMVSGGLMASGNPYAMAAGAGLSVLSASEKAKQRDKEVAYKNRLDRIQRQQSSINNLMSMSSQLRL